MPPFLPHMAGEGPHPLARLARAQAVLRARYAEWNARVSGSSGAAQEVSPELRETLRALGYEH